MTPVHDKLIDHPSAWTSRELGGKQALMLRLDAAQLDAIDVLLQRTRHRQPQDVTREEFDHPAVNALMRQVREIIFRGRGLVIIGGVTPQRYSESDFERIYWGFGTHLGSAAVQSVMGDRLGYVQNKPDDPVNRGYRSLSEMDMHSDSYEIVGLMCVRPAKSGGYSGMVSSLAVHNEILRTRPELLAPLYRGFHYASDEARTSAKPVTDETVPVFSCVDGLVSCTFDGGHLRNAAARLGKPLPDDFAEAIGYFGEVAKRDDLAMSFLLEPGEMMLWHNFTNLHCRTGFEDFPDRRRLLLRLWLTVPDGRPLHPNVLVRARTYERLYRETVEKAVS